MRGGAFGDDSPSGFDVSFWAESEVVTVADSALPGAASTVVVTGLRAAVGGSGLDAVGMAAATATTPKTPRIGVDASGKK